MQLWQPGQQVDKYVIEKVLGGGGFGITYLARERRSQQHFAIKTLNPVRQGKPGFPQEQQKFLNEALRLVSCQHHTHIVSVRELVVEDGLQGMVMEYIVGEDLARYLQRQGALSEDEALRIIRRVGEALICVHEAGFLHRDVKPSNIMLREGSRTPVLIDFGLAREFNLGQIHSMTNSRTEGFAPIEQYKKRGEAGYAEPGHYTDVYALAATLYALLTKQIPIQANFRYDASIPLPPPQQFNLRISSRVNDAIVQGMSLLPKDRPQSIPEWFRLLSGSGDTLQVPVISQPIKQVERLQIPFIPPQPIKQVEQFQIPFIPLQPIKQVERGLFDGLDKTTKRKTFSFEVVTVEVVTVDKYGKEMKRQRHRAEYYAENVGNGVTLDMVYVPGGKFLMGSPDGEGRNKERPQHSVTVAAFHMGRYPVTQAQWKAVAALSPVKRHLNAYPSGFRGDRRPVREVSWYDAVEFCDRLSAKTGKTYRLPSEAEWEYACRAGTTTPFSFGATLTTDLANYHGSYTFASENQGKSRKETTDVGSFAPNAFGLYDLHGNVWEWCADDWHDNYEGAPKNQTIWLSSDKTNPRKGKVLRGGSWNDDPWYCRSACRSHSFPVNPFYSVGFRVCCAAPSNS